MELNASDLFHLPEDHQYAGTSFHPILLVFHCIKLCKFGCRDIQNLYLDRFNVFDLYTDKLVALFYMILCDYFASDGADIYTGAKCKLCYLYAVYVIFM